MPPGRPRNSIERGLTKLQKAWSLGFSKEEIREAIGVSDVWYNKWADEEKGMSDAHLALLERPPISKRVTTIFPLGRFVDSSKWFELESYIFSRVIVADSGCWNWTRGKDGQGYGFGKVNGQQWRVHRLSYVVFVGDIPEGFTVDHLCRNASCVSPTHLEAVTNKVNVLRGIGISANNARKTHCKHGHALTPDNLVKHSRQRLCKACQKRSSQKKRDASVQR